MKITYVAYFQNQDGAVFHWKEYKTFGGAYRFVKQAGALRLAHRFAGWAVVRCKHWTGDDGKYRASAVILAQRDFTGHDGYRFRG